jgi:hypothetical protein
MTNEYYGAPSTPNENFLAHYGVKGMKWGVRKAVESGNSRRLDRQYAKAAKKLAKLEKRAASGRKYAKRAAALGLGAAAAGGAAVAGTSGIGAASTWLGKKGQRGLQLMGQGTSAAGKAIHRGLAATGNGALGNRIHKGMDAAARGMNYAADRVNAVGVKGGNAIVKWGRGRHSLDNAATALHQGAAKVGAGSIGNNIHKKLAGKSVSNNTLFRVGAAGLGAGLAAGAGYNAYRAATTKRAAKKAAQFRSEMNKAFAGTKYAGQTARPSRRRRRR